MADAAPAPPTAPPAGAAPAPKLQFILAGATVPAPLVKRLGEVFKPLLPVTDASSFHRLPATLKHRFIRVTGEAHAKHNALLEILQALTSAEAAASGARDDDDDGGRHDGDDEEEAGGDRGSPRGPKTTTVPGKRGLSPAAGGASAAGGGRAPPRPRILIFCNTIPSARSTAHFLAESGFSAASLHGGIPPKLR